MAWVITVKPCSQASISISMSAPELLSRSLQNDFRQTDHIHEYSNYSIDRTYSKGRRLISEKSLLSSGVSPQIKTGFQEIMDLTSDRLNFSSVRIWERKRAAFSSPTKSNQKFPGTHSQIGSQTVKSTDSKIHIDHLPTQIGTFNRRVEF